jgi:hypothetical protein
LTEDVAKTSSETDKEYVDHSERGTERPLTIISLLEILSESRRLEIVVILFWMFTVFAPGPGIITRVIEDIR